VLRTPQEDIRDAKANGAYAAAHHAAKSELGSLSLWVALDRVLARAGPGVLYDALASRWIAIAIEDRQPSVYEVNWAASRFREHLEPNRDCTAQLRRLAAKGRQPPTAPEVEGDEAQRHLALVDEALDAEDLVVVPQDVPNASHRRTVAES